MVQRVGHMPPPMTRPPTRAELLECKAKFLAWLQWCKDQPEKYGVSTWDEMADRIGVVKSALSGQLHIPSRLPSLKMLVGGARLSGWTIHDMTMKWPPGWDPDRPVGV